MPYESALAGLQIIVGIIQFGALLLTLKIALAVSDLRTEVLKLMADHIRDYHYEREQRVPR